MIGNGRDKPIPKARSADQIRRSSVQVGRYTLFPLNDGVFTMPDDFLTAPGLHRELADASGAVRLPIGCFLLPGDPTVLIDAGFGRRVSERLHGGLLLEEMSAIGFEPSDIEIIALSHLHRDHSGWLGPPDDDRPFSRARVQVGAADWDFFIQQQALPVEPAVRSALVTYAERGKLTLIEKEKEITTGLIALPAPGHTPGHTVFAIVDGQERALLLGDAMYCPQQLTELDWGSVRDVDPGLARRTRESLQRDLEMHNATGLGCHFPGLKAGRLLGGN